ncbi:uncharacterized protein EAE97_012186 [Botrytis byssoidea]|uniref:AMP-dependent synthetase/ligase domain-containing protein n=1 Tax=Botrytis byssoidea TaxID=139641 RepID=A0A9P5HKS2_9HELO|nr:uncharacterized protein EAE97_012186 [Botrytis byssoidea]KAF7915728.1 hypothetical protein EAE97_012186 [Botrytis byssoidea]
MIDVASRSQQPPTSGTESSKHVAALVPNGKGHKKIQSPEPQTIDELIRLRALEDTYQKILSYPQEKGGYVDYTFHELDLFAFRVAQRYSECIPLRKSSDEKERVIGLLGPSNLDYIITILALSKLGFTVLFLSTRISTVVYRSLLEATSAQHLLIHDSFAETAEELQSILSTLQVHNILTQETYKNHLGMRGFITLPLYHAHGISSVFLVMFGGSACPDILGDRLVDNGVNLVSHYGTTETGQLMTSFHSSGDKAWNYLRPWQSLEPFLRWEPKGQGTCEVVALDGWPSKVASNRPDGAYATKDFFTPHPTIPGAWKYYARSDDTIVLLDDEKAVPTMIEQAVRQHRSVQGVVIFGNGMPLLGMIVIPSEVMSNASTTQVIDSIWSIFEEQNTSSAAYAQISRSMIKVLPVGTS